MSAPTSRVHRSQAARADPWASGHGRAEPREPGVSYVYICHGLPLLSLSPNVCNRSVSAVWETNVKGKAKQDLRILALDPPCFCGRLALAPSWSLLFLIFLDFRALPNRLSTHPLVQKTKTKQFPSWRSNVLTPLPPLPLPHSAPFLPPSLLSKLHMHRKQLLCRDVITHCPRGTKTFCKKGSGMILNS